MCAMSDKKTTAQQLLEASSLGFMFPIAMGLGFGWGWLMDRWLGTWPWLTALFTLFGIIAAFRNLYRLAADADDTLPQGDGSTDETGPSEDA